MLGVIHRDESGPALLRSWLEEIQPDVITVELSHYGIRFRRELGDQYKEIIVRVTKKREERGEQCNSEAFASLISYVCIPYEYETISGYAAEKNIPYHLIDMDFFSYVKLRDIGDLLGEDNIEIMLADTEGMNGSQELAMARFYFEKGITIAKYDREMYIRDRYMSARIDDLMKHRQNNRFLHVCGWQHLQDPSGLYSHFNPIKVFSHDKTFCI
jgi:hypothetical protein